MQLQPILECQATAHGAGGWHAHTRYRLPAGYRLAFDSFADGDNIVTLARAYAVETPLDGAQGVPQLAWGAAERALCERLSWAPGRATQHAVAAQHRKVVLPVLVANWTRRAQEHFRIHTDADAVALAVETLTFDPQDQGGPTVHTYIRRLCTAGADVARERIVAALQEGFAISDALLHDFSQGLMSRNPVALTVVAAVTEYGFQSSVMAQGDGFGGQLRYLAAAPNR